MLNQVVGNNYILQKKIGQGSFGKIFIAQHNVTGKKYAVKLEDADSRVPQIAFEARMYNTMSGSTNVPRIYHNSNDLNYNMIAIDLLGKSLEDLLTQCHRQLSLKTVLMLVDQMISAVQFFHMKNYIHRDIKPDNFVMGLENKQNQIYIIDYGLAKKYRDVNTHDHIKYIEGKSLTGTARYASINALSGCEQSRRDDMEGLAYVWIYLLKGSLPWMGIDAHDRHLKYARIADSKRSIAPEMLCKSIPSTFATYLKMVRNLKFTEEPDYGLYKKMFRDLFRELGYVYDYKYDWTESRSSQHMLQRRLSMDYNLADRRTLERVNSMEAVVSGEFSIDVPTKDDDQIDTDTGPSDLVPVRFTRGKKPTLMDAIRSEEGITLQKPAEIITLQKPPENVQTPKKEKETHKRRMKKRRKPSVEKLTEERRLQEESRRRAEEQQRIEEERFAEERRRREEERKQHEEECRKRIDEERCRRRAEEERRRREDEEVRKRIEEMRRQEERRAFEEAERARKEEERRIKEEQRAREEERRRRHRHRHRHQSGSRPPDEVPEKRTRRRSSRSRDYKSGEYKSGEHRSGEYYKSGEYRSGEFSGEYNRRSHEYNRSGDYYRSGEYRSGEYRSGDYKSGEYKSGEYRSREGHRHHHRSSREERDRERERQVFLRAKEEENRMDSLKEFLMRRGVTPHYLHSPR